MKSEKKKKTKKKTMMKAKTSRVKAKSARHHRRKQLERREKEKKEEKTREDEVERVEDEDEGERRREKWRVLKFVITASSDRCKVGKPSYTLLEPYSKKRYMELRKLYLGIGMDLEGLYVDLKTRKLWKVVKENIEDFEKFAIDELLESGVAFEPYDPETASRTVSVRALRENFVEWWCR